jgi:GntR family transcriptional regulator
VPPRDRELPSRRVETDLRRRIDADEWEHGKALPSVADLAEHYGVARGTVAKALRRLAGDGLVEIIPAWGTFRT